MNLKAFFLSRWTILFFISVLACAIALAYIVPQGFVSSPEELRTWREGHPLLGPYVESLGLNNVYSSTWFLLTLSLAIVSLSLPSVRQYEAARHKTFGAAAAHAGGGITVDIGLEGMVKALRGRGYLRIGGEAGGGLRFIKHPWGHWGNFLLHLGIVVTLASSMYAALTLKSGMRQYIESMTLMPGAPWLVEDSGLLGGRLQMPSAVRVESIMPEFWDNGRVRQITTLVSFITDGEYSRQRRVSVNSMQTYNGMRIYQTLDFGDAFHLVFTDAQGNKNEMATLVPHPQGLRKEGYGDFQPPHFPYLVRVKYLTDAAGKELWGNDPLVTVRLMEKDRNAGQATLRKGEVRQVGEYKVTLEQTGKWTGLVFVHMGGMPGLFTGFFVMVIGAAFNYFTPPREVTAIQSGEGYELSWRAVKFAAFYQDEYERLFREIGRGSA